MAEQCAPRVGKAVFQDGPFFEAIQNRYPDKQLVVVDVCRGVDRLRTCPIGSKGHAPFRHSFGRRRQDLQDVEDAEWELWESLSKRQHIRSGTLSSASGWTESVPKLTLRRLLKNQVPDNIPSNPNQLEHHIQDHSSQQIKCQSYGPRFPGLGNQTQLLIKKIHQNLGHPDNRVLQLAIRRAGWSERAISACSDFKCPTCVEHQLPKIARPGKHSGPKDFNDHVSFDGAEWRDPQGKTYPFFHFIDTATNFHVAIPYQQRSTEGLKEALPQHGLDGLDLPKVSCSIAPLKPTAKPLPDSFKNAAYRAMWFQLMLTGRWDAPNGMERHSWEWLTSFMKRNPFEITTISISVCFNFAVPRMRCRDMQGIPPNF